MHAYRTRLALVSTPQRILSDTAWIAQLVDIPLMLSAKSADQSTTTVIIVVPGYVVAARGM